MRSLITGYGKLVFLVSISAIFTSCAVGPNFHRPDPPFVRSYTERPLPRKTVSVKHVGSSGKSQEFIVGKRISGEWWTLFHSPELNELICMGLEHSPNLIAAKAALREAQETLRAQIGLAFFPAVDFVASAQRQKFSNASFGGGISGVDASSGSGNGSNSSSINTGDSSTIFNLFTANFVASYTLDVFGGLRRQVEAVRAHMDFQEYELLAAYLTLTSNIVVTTITIASLEAQIKATHELIRAERKELKIIKTQFELGAVSGIEVATQTTLVAQTEATLPPLEKSLAQARHSLAVLIGDFPDRPLPHFELDKLNLPKEIPISLPSELICQRPDVRASEALLHQASAQIGVATANLLPTFLITGNYGWQGNVASQLFSASNEVWTIMAQMTQPLVRGGALFAQRRAAIAAYQQACAQYQETVLTAFQNVADALRAIETDARALKAQKKAEDAAFENLHLTQSQYRLGGTSYLNLLTAQVQYENARISRIQAQAQRYSDTAGLYQALGGGWWNKICI